MSIIGRLSVRTARSCVLPAALLAASIAHAPAQQPGDVVMSTFSGLYSTGATAGGATARIAGLTVDSVLMGSGNREMLVSSSSTGTIYRVFTNGVYSTLSTLTGRISQMARDQDGSYFAASLSGNALLRVSGAVGTTVATLASANGICRNLQDGSFCVVQFSSRGVVRYDPRTNTLSTLTTLPSSGSGPSNICYLPDTNAFAVSQLNTTGGIVLLSTAGTVTRTIATPGSVNAITYDQIRQTIYAGTTTGHLIRYSNNGTALQTRQFTGLNISGLEIFGDRNVSVSTTGTRGALCGITGHWDSSPSQQACFALSTGLRPGIFLSGSGRNQPILPDTLFFRTVCGGLPFFTQGFAGSTNSNGTASAAFTVPFGVPLGMMFYVAGTAVNPAAPESLDLGTVDAVQVR